jgi:hypothetical protein
MHSKLSTGDNSAGGREQLDECLSQMTHLVDLTRVKGGYQIVDKKDSELLTNLLKTCASSLDVPLFEAQFEDWSHCVKAQNDIVQNEEFREFANTLRETEIELGIAVASKSSLEMLVMRLGVMERDRQARFDLLQEIIHDISLRELGGNITLSPLRADIVAEMPPSLSFGTFSTKVGQEEESLLGLE